MSKSSKKFKDLNITHLPGHKQKGKNLIPPFANLPNAQKTSWVNDQLPEFIWAALILNSLSREVALSIFRKIGVYIGELPENEKITDISLSSLAKLPDEQFSSFLKALIFNKEIEKILSPLLLIKVLPAYDKWASNITIPVCNSDWKSLMQAVSTVFNHHSQEATDIQWLILLVLSISGKLYYPDEELAEEIRLYPNYGDQCKVRPTIRAMVLAQITLANRQKWNDIFWDYCHKNTPCLNIQTDFTNTEIPIGFTKDNIDKMYKGLIEYFHKTNFITDVDAKHDIVFGSALFSVAIAQDLLRLGNSQSICSRFALRTIVESYITLFYLTQKNGSDLWATYRLYGVGQAKLTFLKMLKTDNHSSFINIETLHQLSNEDMWQEFVPINLGHWDNSDLRKMSTEIGLKDIYDKYYDWTSSFSHGRWGAIRDSVFDVCGNPLHRFHRIPRDTVRLQPDLIEDVRILLNKIFELVDKNYPYFPDRL